MWRFLESSRGSDQSRPSSSNDALNISVEKELASLKQKRSYEHYSPEDRAKIGRFAAENGNSRAVKKFGFKMGRPVPESTVRSFKKQYLAELKAGGPNKDPSAITALEKKRVGRPLKLGGLDEAVQTRIGKIMAAGGTVNRSVVKATATGLVKYYKPSALPHLEITDGWVRSMYNRMGLVKRKGRNL